MPGKLLSERPRGWWSCEKNFRTVLCDVALHHLRCLVDYEVERAARHSSTCRASSRLATSRPRYAPRALIYASFDSLPSANALLWPRRTAVTGPSRTQPPSIVALAWWLGAAAPYIRLEPPFLTMSVFRCSRRPSEASTGVLTAVNTASKRQWGGQRGSWDA